MAVTFVGVLIGFVSFAAIIAAGWFVWKWEREERQRRRAHDVYSFPPRPSRTEYQG